MKVKSIGEVKIGNSKVICSIPNSVVPLRFTLCLDVEWEIAIRPIRLANQPIPGWCPFLKDRIAVSKYAAPKDIFEICSTSGNVSCLGGGTIRKRQKEEWQRGFGDEKLLMYQR